METIMNQFTQLTGSYIPRLLGALVILVVGWLVAILITGAIRKVLIHFKLDSHLTRWTSGGGKEEPIAARFIAKLMFYVIMLFVIVATFEALGITLITQPINTLLNELLAFAPQLLGALLLAIVAFIVAKAFQIVVAKGLGALKMDEQLEGKAGIKAGKQPLAQSLSNGIFWLVLLLFLPAILSTLGVEGLLKPVQGMVEKILAFLPNIFTAVVIVLLGWLLARMVQRIVTNFFEAIGTDRLSEKVGMASAMGKKKLSSVLGMLVYILILIPILVAALNALALEAITQPASKMLEMILMAIPNVFAALLILIISYMIGRVLAGLVASILEGAGFNSVLARLGIGDEIPADKKWTPAIVIGNIVLIGIMLFAFIEAVNRLGFAKMADMLAGFTVLAGQVILGLVIFGVGLLLAKLVSKAILSTAPAQASVLAMTARIAIMVLAGAIALRQMGLANEIISLAFGLIIGAIALALALAFGIGGRETAAKELEDWVKSMKTKTGK
ncbi:MAG: mechanosensitive ion channel [Thermodesulfobacteriota bacterium]|nr:MAG: mechanosensitive ion channel [Thermodesulfobacteriota bacterium]